MEEPSIPNPKQSKKNLWDQYVILLGLITASLILVADGLGLNRFLSSANKCCGSPAKANIGSLNRAQQSYFLDHGKLALSWKELDLLINAETEDYSYSIVNFGQHAFNYARSKHNPVRVKSTSSVDIPLISLAGIWVGVVECYSKGGAN